MATSGPDEKRREAMVTAVVLLAALLPYLNTLANGFVYDDFSQILDNPYVTSLRYLAEIFTTNVWSFQGEQGLTNYYRPLMTLSFLLCYLLFGPLPYGFHLVNVALHALASWLVYRVGRDFLADRAVALVAALLFALHPVHTEAVAWISALPDLQLTVLFLLAFWLYLRRRSAEETPARRALRTALLLLIAAAALLAKEPAAVLPVLLIVWEHFLASDCKQHSARAKLRRYAPLVFLVAGYVALRLWMFATVAPVLQRPGLSWYEAIVSALALVWQYAVKLVWPFELSAFYPFEKSTSLLEADVLAGIAVLAAVAVGALALRRRAPAVSLALLWMVLTLLPVLNARWMAANVFAERYLYLPSVGFCWAAGWALVRLVRAWQPQQAVRWAAGALALAITVAFTLRTVTRNADWRDPQTLFRKTLETHPDAHIIRANLGAYYFNLGDYRAAERELRLAIEHIPHNVATLNNLGLLYTREKRYAEAERMFLRAIAERPEYTAAQMNLGLLYEEMGELEQARERLEHAARLSPLNVKAQNRLGEFLYRHGWKPEARDVLARSLDTVPTAEAAALLAQMHLEEGDPATAETLLLRAVELNPYDSASHLALARLYQSRGNTEQARAHYHAVLETDPGNAEAAAALDSLPCK